jgi:hypothetical protein
MFFVIPACLAGRQAQAGIQGLAVHIIKYSLSYNDIHTDLPWIPARRPE